MEEILILLQEYNRKKPECQGLISISFFDDGSGRILDHDINTIARFDDTTQLLEILNG